MKETASARLERLFGFPFPDDFFQFQDWLKQHPILDIRKNLEISTSGLFDVFNEDFGKDNLFEFMHGIRYYGDPPEFVTVFRGYTDGLHWGYYFDSPAEISPCVVHYYHRDAYEFSLSGSNLFEAVRLQLEGYYETTQEYVKDDEKYAEEYIQELKHMDEVMRPALLPFSPFPQEVGRKYCDAYQAHSYKQRQAQIVCPTYNDMGIVAPKETYKPIDNVIYKSEDEATESSISVAYQCLEKGLPANALQIAHNFWTSNKAYQEQVYDLFKKSYEALGRVHLIPLLEVAIESRKTFDKSNEEQARRYLERIKLFVVGTQIDFRGIKGEILQITGEGLATQAIVKFEDEAEAKPFMLQYHAHHFHLPSDI